MSNNNAYYVNCKELYCYGTWTYFRLKAWRYLVWGLAAVYQNRKEWTLAIETQEALKKDIESGETKDDDPTTVFPDILRELASRYEEAGNHDKASEIYETLLR